MECIENVQCTPRTEHRLRMVILLRGRARDGHIDRSIFSLIMVINIPYVHWYFKAILFIFFHEHEQKILFSCPV